MTSPNQADAPTLTEIVAGTVRSARPAGAVIARLREERRRILETLIARFFSDMEAALERAFDPAQLAPEQPILFYARRQLQANRQQLVAAFVRELRCSEPSPVAMPPDSEWMGQEPLTSTSRRPRTDAPDCIGRAASAVLSNLPNTTDEGLASCMNELTALSGLPLETPLAAARLALSLSQGFSRAISNLNTDARVPLLLVALFEHLILSKIEPRYDPQAEGQPTIDGKDSDPGPNETPPCVTPMASLLQALDRLQRKTLISIKSGQQSSAPLLLEMHRDANLDDLNPSERENHSRGIAAIMAPALMLVSQLFTTARSSSGRPSEVEELLARLHVPLLKLAVIDAGGMQHPTHPGRELLQLLIAASARRREHGRGISSRMLADACTTRILRDFARDPALFEQVTKGLRIALQDTEYDEIQACQESEDRGRSERAEIQLGTWVELHRPETPALRCRLHSISDAEGRYVFENQRGFEVLALNRQELALALIGGDLQVLTESAYFERSLRTLMGTGHARTSNA